jgi:hypothetical protein
MPTRRQQVLDMRGKRVAKRVAAAVAKRVAAAAP